MDGGELATLLVLLRRPETAIGAAVGVIALWLVVWVWSRRRRRRPELAGSAGAYGAAWVVAAVIALAAARDLPAAVVVVLAVAGATAGRLWHPVRLGAVVGAGIWLALTVPGGGLAGRIAVGIALPAAVASSAWWPRHGGGRLLPVLLAVTAAGQVAVLPDVEEVLTLAAVAGVLALGTLPPVRARFGAAGAAGAAALLVWTAGAGGYGRPSAVVGGLTALGLVLAVPTGLALAGRRGPPSGRAAVIGVLLAHLAVVALVTRNAGLRATAGEAWLVAGGVLAVSVAVSALAVATIWSEVREQLPHDGR